MQIGVDGGLFEGISQLILDPSLEGLRRESILSIFGVDESADISKLGDKVRPILLFCSVEQDVGHCIGEEVKGIVQQFNDQASLQHTGARDRKSGQYVQGHASMPYTARTGVKDYSMTEYIFDLQQAVWICSSKDDTAGRGPQYVLPSNTASKLQYCGSPKNRSLWSFAPVDEPVRRIMKVFAWRRSRGSGWQFAVWHRESGSTKYVLNNLNAYFDGKYV